MSLDRGINKEEVRYIYIYIYIYTHTHTHTHIHIYIYRMLENSKSLVVTQLI